MNLKYLRRRYDFLILFSLRFKKEKNESNKKIIGFISGILTAMLLKHAANNIISFRWTLNNARRHKPISYCQNLWHDRKEKFKDDGDIEGRARGGSSRRAL